jgi:GNAT superfamily N-acetyltransferase
MPLSTAERSESPKRVSTPTSETPATFRLNWKYYGDAVNPKKGDAATYFLRPAWGVFLDHDERITTSNANEEEEDDRYHTDVDEDEKIYLVLSKLLQVVRKQDGLTCTIPLQGGNKRMLESDETKFKTEKEVLENSNGTTYQVLQKQQQNQKESKVVMLVTCYYNSSGCKNPAMLKPWIIIRWLQQSPQETSSRQKATFAELAKWFLISNPIKDQQNHVLNERNGIVTEIYTGEKEGAHTDAPFVPSTLFTMRSGDSAVLAKALCTYEHVEFDAGPTIQLFEVAAEWRRHGHGKALFSTMEKYYQSIFAPMVFEGIGLYVHYVCQDSGHTFFEKLGFSTYEGEEMYRDLHDEAFMESFY